MTRSARLLAATISLTAASSVLAQPQPEPPKMSRQQRAALQAVVRAAESNAVLEDVDDQSWPVHLLRTSDGAHYVAFSIASPHVVPGRPMVVYVRLATRRDIRVDGPAERSLVAEWLAGQAPMPPLNRRGIAFGDMPTFGAGAIATRGPGPQSLQLLEMERQRERQRREEEAQKRKQALEGAAGPRGPRPPLPFEDFDVDATATSTNLLQRSVSAGPGDYDLIVGWADPQAGDAAAAVHLVRRRLSLPPASTTDFALSTVIVADGVSVRETPLPPDQQSSRPYSIGTLDIVPAPDRILTNDERLAVVVQVINARGTPAGKPDVGIGFRIFRRAPTGEEAIGTLAPQTYNDTTLPADFDAAKHHPIFAAVAVPLRTFRRGDYRLEIAATDRVAGIGSSANVTFTVNATPAALLREAPSPAAPFRRDDLLQRAVLDDLLAKLSPAQPSSAFAAVVVAAREGRYTELIRDDGGVPEEAASRAALRAVALYALGEGPASLQPLLRQAAQRGASSAALHTIAGALRALDGSDQDAITEWEAAAAAGADERALASLLSAAWLRRGNPARAAEVAESAALPTDVELLRRIAAARLAAGRHAEALRLLDPIIMRRPDDGEAMWLALHALFASYVAGSGPGADAAGHARIAALATRYGAVGGANAALAREWAAVVK